MEHRWCCGRNDQVVRETEEKSVTDDLVVNGNWDTIGEWGVTEEEEEERQQAGPRGGRGRQEGGPIQQGPATCQDLHS